MAAAGLTSKGVILPYTNPPDWVNDSAPFLSADNLDIISENQRVHETRLAAAETTVARAKDGIVYASEYGFDPAASAATNKTALQNAMTAASGFSLGGVVKMGAGAFNVDGGITQPPDVVLDGVSAEATRISHTTNDVFVTCLGLQASAQRGWGHFRLTGNSGAAAKGIVYGNASNMPTVDEINITGYTAGTGMELRNTDPSEGWTEESSFRHLNIANCGVCLDFQNVGAYNSFSSTRFKHVLLRCAASGQIGMRFGASTLLYSSDVNLKIMLQANNTTAIDVAAGVFLERNHWNILIEGSALLTGLVALNSGANSIINGTGSIQTYGSIPFTWNIGGSFDLPGGSGGTTNRTNTSGTVTLTEWSPEWQRFTANLTGNLTVALPTLNLYPNKRFRIERLGYGTFALIVGSNVFTFPYNTTGWVEIMWTGSAWIVKDYELKLYDYSHALFKVREAQAETMPREAQVSAGLTLTSGVLHLFAIPLLSGMTVTTIVFISGTTAAATLTNQWFSLWDGPDAPATGTVRNRLALTTDDTTTAWGANASKALNLTAPYSVTVSGLYYIGIMVAATTVPTLAGGFGAASVQGNLTPALSLTSTTGLTTTATAPTVAPFSSAGQIRPYAYVR